MADIKLNRKVAARNEIINSAATHILVAVITFGFFGCLLLDKLFG